MSPELSVVVPIYNELDSLGELLNRLDQSLRSLPIHTEILIIDDASSDGSSDLLQKWAGSGWAQEGALGEALEQSPEQSPDQSPDQSPERSPAQSPERSPDQSRDQAPDQSPEQSPAQSPNQATEQSSNRSPEQSPAPNTPTLQRRVLSLAQNIGQYGATRAGLLAAKGRRVAVLDGDLQDPPELLPRLYQQAEQNPQVQVLFAVKSERKDSWPLRLAQNLFHGIQSRLSQSPYQAGAGSYCLIDGELARSLGQVPIENANLASVLTLLNVEKSSLRYSKNARQHGNSRVGLLRLIHEALESMLLTGALERLVVMGALLLAFVGLWANQTGEQQASPSKLGSLLVWAAILMSASWFMLKKRRQRLVAPLVQLEANLKQAREPERG